MADTDTISLDDLIRQITEHLAETDAKYRAYVAAQLQVEYESDDYAIEAINEALVWSDPSAIIAIANDCLTNRYSYDEDSLVTVTYKDDATPGPS